MAYNSAGLPDILRDSARGPHAEIIVSSTHFRPVQAIGLHDDGFPRCRVESTHNHGLMRDTRFVRPRFFGASASALVSCLEGLSELGTAATSAADNTADSAAAQLGHIAGDYVMYTLRRSPSPHELHTSTIAARESPHTMWFKPWMK